MQHEIINKLNQSQIEILKGLVGQTLYSVFVDEAGEFALSVVLDTGNKYISLRNIPTIQSDDDEYPCLVVEETAANLKEYKQITIGKNIEGINIVRDKTSWQYNKNKWYIESDIAIKISIKELNLLLVAHDSLAGFIKVINTKESLPNDVFDEFWSMKTEMLDFLERKELSI